MRGRYRRNGDLRVMLGHEVGGSELTICRKRWSKGLEVIGLGSGWERDMARGRVLVRGLCTRGFWFPHSSEQAI